MSDKIAEIRARHERDNRYGDGLYPGAHKDRAWLLAEVERLRVVLRQCACSCKALRESCPQLEMDGTCPHLSAQEALEAKP